MEMGFQLNLYDNCVANKDIEGKQCIIAWWVDNNFMSHIQPKVLTKVIEDIEAKFGKMTVTRGDKHVFLGIKIQFPGDGTVGILVDNYLMDAFQAFGEPLTRRAASPALKDLLYVDMGSSPTRRRPGNCFFTEPSGFLHATRLEEITLIVEFPSGHNQ